MHSKDNHKYEVFEKASLRMGGLGGGRGGRGASAMQEAADKTQAFANVTNLTNS